MNLVVMLFDNNCYGLTKNQTSPTSPKGAKSNTHPRGAALEPLNPVQTTLGIANVSFVARTVDWNPPHLFATLQAAHRHQGLSFVQIVQRCPHYKAGVHDPLQSDPSQLLLMTHPDGIQLEDSIQKIFKNQQEHDPSDMDTARELAGGDGAIAIGLFYRNQSLDRYDEYTATGIATPRDEKIAALNAELSRYQI
jgi:2-oxoglutarate ferredoxin oxidoreductase subunit beta